MQSRPLGLIDNWLRHIRDVHAMHRAELDAIGDEEEQADRLCELNVAAQVANVCRTATVQDAWRQGRRFTRRPCWAWISSSPATHTRVRSGPSGTWCDCFNRTSPACTGTGRPGSTSALEPATGARPCGSPPVPRSRGSFCVARARATTPQRSRHPAPPRRASRVRPRGHIATALGLRVLLACAPSPSCHPRSPILGPDAARSACRDH